MVSMAMGAPQPPRDAARDEALWLVRLWRRSPLTLLLSDADAAGADPFIADSVLPLTARRAIDHAAVSLRRDPASDRGTLFARQTNDAAPVSELVLRFDASRHADPAAALRQAWWSLWPGGPQPLPADVPPDSLWKTASILHAASGARVLLVLEGLQDWLLPRADAPGPRQALLDELSGLLADASVRAHALLVLEPWAEPLLETLWRRMPALSRQLLLLDATRAQPQAVPDWIDSAVWRQMRPAQTLPAPWPYAPSAVEVFEHCESPQPAPTGASSQVPQIPPPFEEWKPS